MPWIANHFIFMCLLSPPLEYFADNNCGIWLIGAPQGVNIPKDTRNPVKAAEPSTEEKRREV